VKKMVFEGRFNKALLMEELLDAFPDWIQDEQSNFTMKGSETKIRLWFPDEYDEKDVQAVVDAHDHTVEHPVVAADREYRQRLKQIAAKDPEELMPGDLNFMAVEAAKRITMPGPKVMISDEKSLGSTFALRRGIDA
jgi:hypothetical protein